MPRFTQIIARIARALVALGCGVLVGATLAVVALEGRFSALTDLVWRAGWFMRERPTGLADGMWALEIEWWIAVESALLIALVGAIVWAAVSWRGRQSYRAAALIGFVLATAMALFWLNGDEAMTLHCTLIGLCGAVAGVVTRAADRTIGRLGLKTARQT